MVLFNLEILKIIFFYVFVFVVIGLIELLLILILIDEIIEICGYSNKECIG